MSRQDGHTGTFQDRVPSRMSFLMCLLIVATACLDLLMIFIFSRSSMPVFIGLLLGQMGALSIWVSPRQLA